MIVGLVVSSCEEVSELGNSTVASPTDIYFTDSVTVSMATVIIDSLPTNGQGIQLVGMYDDALLGLTEAQSYFQVAPQGRLELDENSVFDSLALILHYQDYYYGDTLAAQTLQILRVIEEYQPDEGTLYYNTTDLKTHQTPLAEFTFQPRPNQRDSLVIPLDPKLGQRFFQLALDNDDRLLETADFLEYFRGISLKSTNTQAVLSFSSGDAGCYLELYYHQLGETIEQRQHRFPVFSEESQFNRITSNREQTLLRDLTLQKEAVNAPLTDQQSYVQAGVGVMTRLQFPYLQNLIKQGNLFIISAELEIKPVTATGDDQRPLPASLILSQTDAFNALGAVLNQDFSDQPQVAPLQLDQEFGIDTYYRFSLTEYLDNELFLQGPGDGLLLTLPQPEFFKSVHRLYIGSNQNPTYTTKLLLTYMITS